jgi:hypothetical protein
MPVAKHSWARNSNGSRSSASRKPKGVLREFSVDHRLHQNGSNKEAKNEHQAYFNSGFSIGPALAGSELAASDFTVLEARWIDGPLALAAQLRRVDSLSGAELVGRKSGNHAGVAIPYFFPGTVKSVSTGSVAIALIWRPTARGRPNQNKISQPAPSRKHVVLHAGHGRSSASRVPLPLIITEGEFKRLALWRARELESH